ncbi:MAG: hypothetical protein K6E16_01385 [Lachnospiraceae bacterium]|nr:hypothetical protein [Lachnospiraceae bacterium]
MTDPLEELLKQQEQQDVLAYLNQLSQNGTQISVEGHVVPLEQLAKVISLSEGICYMPDYLRNEKGNLTEIRFNRVYLT